MAKMALAIRKLSSNNFIAALKKIGKSKMIAVGFPGSNKTFGETSGMKQLFLCPKKLYSS